MATTSAARWRVDREGTDPGFGRYVVASPTKLQIHDLVESNKLIVKNDEQRGLDPVTTAEILNKAKMEEWHKTEKTGELFLGQLNYAIYDEANTKWEIITDSNGQKWCDIDGLILIPDGRQRTWTVTAAVADALKFSPSKYDIHAPLTVILWLDATSDVRKEIYAQLNGGRGGDHASESSVEYMAPKGPMQFAAKYLVDNSVNLTQSNVNVKKNAVVKKDQRLAGFHTFVKALENAWGQKRREPTPTELEHFQGYLVEFYDALATVRPEMGNVALAIRQKAREDFITSNPLFIYGILQVAVDLYLNDPARTPNLDVLETLRGKDGDKFLSLHNQDWKDNGVMSPQWDPKTKKVKSYTVTNNLQTRRAMVSAMVARFTPVPVAVAV